MNNNYAITRSIRFKLNPQNNALNDEIKKLQSSFSQEDSQPLIQKLNHFVRKLSEYMLNKDERISFDLKVKDRFLRNFAKAEYIESSIKKSNFYAMSQIRFIANSLTTTLKRFTKLVEKYEQLQQQPVQQQAKKAEFALLLKELSNKNNFILLKEFVFYSQNTKNEAIKKELSNTIDNIEPLLLKARNFYLPAQSSGIVIAKASLNYYTIDKKPKDYDVEILEEKKYLNYLYDNDKTNFLKYTINCRDEGKVFEKLIHPILPEKITIADAYNSVKEYKANAKSKFYEAVNSGDIEFEKITNDHPLFECSKDAFEAFLLNTNKIKQLNAEINQLDSINDKNNIKKNRDEIAKISQKRGKELLLSPHGKAKKYIYLSNIFKEIAIKYGQQKAKIKSLELEKLQSQTLNYWLLIHQINQNKHQLVLIPKENRQNAKAIMEHADRLSDIETNNYLCWFKSLTLRALRKLCFSGNQNSFVKGLQDELSKYTNIKASYSLENLKTDRELIAFYQSVITSEYFNNVIDVEDFQSFQELQEKHYKTIEEFEIDLEKTCYTLIKVEADETIDNLVKECNAQILSIESYDLKKDGRRASSDKLHTKLWKQFWSAQNHDEKYPVRLNPEIAISYRLAKETRLKKYDINSKNYHAQRFSQNRYCHPQLTLNTTITENATSNKLDFAFLDNDKLAESINKFNQKFNKELPKNKSDIFFYGIDRGNDELATLATIAKFGKENLEFLKFDVYKLKDIKHFQDIILKDGTQKQRHAIDNISYFIDQDSLFERFKVTAIDLTTSKLIKGKIVVNGDVKTYLKLKLLAAKRRIYEYFSQTNLKDMEQTDSNLRFEDSKQVFYIKSNKNNPDVKIYFFRTELKEYISKVDIENQLKKYLLDLKYYNSEKDLLTIEKINNLRDAISANMIGIFTHIYKEHKGIFVLEDLNSSDINKFFIQQSNESISRRLEWALYKKMQHFSVVPPNLKDTIVLREADGIKQFGNILFIKPDQTSTQCPKCEEIATEVNNLANVTKQELKKIYDKNKFNHRKFVCPHCGFDTLNPSHNLKGIESPDTLASFNIAKRGYQFILNPPQINKVKRSTSKKQYSKKNNRQEQIKSRNKPTTNKPLSGLADMLKDKK